MADIIVDTMVRVAFVPTIANIAAPTVAELNAGTLLQATLVPTGLEGFENSVAEVDNTSLASGFDTKLPGRKSYSGTGLLLKKQDGTDTVFNLLTVDNTNGHIVIRVGIAESTAWTAAQTPVGVHPIRTGGWTWVGLGEANTVARYRVFTPITSAPNLKAVVAA